MKIKLNLDDCCASTANLAQKVCDFLQGKTSLPAGGKKGQVLTKTSDADFSVEWRDLSACSIRFSTSQEFKTNDIWIDGRPIYTKVVDFGNLATTFKTVPIGVEGYLDVWIDYQNSFVTWYNQRYPLQWEEYRFAVTSLDTTNQCGIIQEYILDTQDPTPATALVTVRYTKIADLPI